MGLLIVTAVEAEAEAVRAGVRDPGVRVAAVGVGPAAAAAGTARLLALDASITAVLIAGIAGGFAGRVEVGAAVVATRSVAADLGAESPDGFVPLASLGFGLSTVDYTLAIDVPGAVRGEVLTVSTVTGTAESAEALARRHPDAVAEAMEGFGAATAAAQAGVACAELRTISNLVGPRDRAAWRVAAALKALTSAVAAATVEPC
jgi:futalosine hydrolase